MKRIVLFLVTNLAIVVVLGVALRLLGLERILDERGIDLNYSALLGFAAVLGMGGSAISLALSKWTAKRLTGCQVIEQPSGEQELWLVASVRRHAEAAGIGMPEVAVCDGAPNAFATGARRNAALVAVSSGLLHKMRRNELDAVLAHEISHIANGDMITLALLQGVINTFVIFLSRVVGHFVDRVLLRNERGHGLGYFLSTIAAEVVFGFLASAIVLWFSRRREFRADSGGARLAGRDNMIAALQRLQEGSEPLPEQLGAFGISGKPGALLSWFSSHPPLQVRIEALRALPD
jgi:heat shock protein HtpX